MTEQTAGSGEHRSGRVRRAVAEQLRAALITGTMRPGHLYSAPQLAEMFGVSPTPVREAMLDLVREHMVEVVPNKGFRVLPLSDRDLDELVELRLLIEVPIMGAVAESCTGAIADTVRELGTLADDLEEAARAGDIVRFMALDTEFHSRFLALHGNESLVATVREYRGRSRLYGLESLVRRNALDASAAEHRRMVDLALAQDSKALRELTAQHIAHVRGQWADSGDASAG